MTVLLLCSVPDPRRDPAWYASPDEIFIREAVRGLAAAGKTNGMTLMVADHPAIVPLVTAILPASQVRVIQRGVDFVLSRISVAILIGGASEELRQTRQVRDANVRLIPVASTGGAAARLYEEMSAEGSISMRDAFALRSNRPYSIIFERLLSS